jgi:hypothetical protein
VPEVDPDGDEEAKVRANNDRVDVVERFGGLGDGGLVGLALLMTWDKGLTARKKSLMSCVIYTAIPMYVKWKR